MNDDQCSNYDRLPRSIYASVYSLSSFAFPIWEQHIHFQSVCKETKGWNFHLDTGDVSDKVAFRQLVLTKIGNKILLRGWMESWHCVFRYRVCHILPFLPYKIKMQYMQFRLHVEYFLLPLKIPEEMSRRSMLFNNRREYLLYETYVHTTFYHGSGLAWNLMFNGSIYEYYVLYLHILCFYFLGQF